LLSLYYLQIYLIDSSSNIVCGTSELTEIPPLSLFIIFTCDGFLLSLIPNPYNYF